METPKEKPENGKCDGEQKVEVQKADVKKKEIPVHRVKASPWARRIAEYLNVDISKLEGSGRGEVIVSLF